MSMFINIFDYACPMVQDFIQSQHYHLYMKSTGLVNISFQTILLPFPPTLVTDHHWQVTVLVSTQLLSQTKKYWDFYLLIVVQDQMMLEVRQSWRGLRRAGRGEQRSSSYEQFGAKGLESDFLVRFQAPSLVDMGLEAQEQVPMPQLPHLQNEAKICNYLVGLLGGLSNQTFKVLTLSLINTSLQGQ